jgi:carbon monoxide dehydrogenase subunit G
VKISGTQTLTPPPEKMYAAMQDPVVLARAIPGCEGMEKVGEGLYKMKMKVAMAAFSGAFDGTVRISDPVPPKSFRLTLEGTGKLGFLKGDGLLTLTPSGEGTEVSYDGDAQIGGVMAAVGQRLIDGTSKMMIKKFFDKLAEEAAAAG